MQVDPVICQYAVWGSKQQRYRHCKLPAKLSTDLVNQIKVLQERCFQDGVTEDPQNQLDQFLALRTELLQSEYEAEQVLCGHHLREAQEAQRVQDQIEREKAAGTYQDPEDLKRLAKEQPVDPKDIPKKLLTAIQRVFSVEPSPLAREVLDRWDGREEWQGQVSKDWKLDRDIEVAFPCHESYEHLFAEAGVKRKRHLAQESQLIHSMTSFGLLDPVLRLTDRENDMETEGNTTNKNWTSTEMPRPVFVEFGAGTGGLSRHIQLVLESVICKRTAAPSLDSLSSSATTTSTIVASSGTSCSQPCAIDPFNFVLLDRQKFRSRSQVDYMIRTQARPVKPRLLRITKDVRELKLQDLQLIHETEPGIARPEWTEGGGDVEPQEASTKVPTHYICVSKHFCGPATDMALAWMKDQQQKQTQQQDSYSICFATCCHGICEPSLLRSKPHLKDLFEDAQGCKGSEEDLDAWIPWMIKLTGWATLGKQEESSLVARPGKDAPTTSPSNRNDDATMTRDQRRVLGKRCKKLLDMARCLYLIRECGFKQAKAIEYTTESVESGAIVGTM
ncbi:hypothetical protein BGX34_001997 [Mortierella sp. NVP85]|nr:hypothetical protein BGX34_001997 [Mortierella sp. NVP85]